MAPRLVTAYDTRTGEKRNVPENWFDHEELSEGLSRTDPGILRRPPEGHDSPVRPDDADYATPEELAAADAAAGELKGQALKDALKEAGLPQTGTAAEQRAALVAHQEQAEADRLAALEDPTDSTTGDHTNPPATGDQQ